MKMNWVMSTHSFKNNWREQNTEAKLLQMSAPKVFKVT